MPLYLLRGSEQYGMLKKYFAAIRLYNPRSIMILHTPRGVFEGIYICFYRYKRGFVEGCRPLIEINGYHLKGEYKGYLLEAIGKDANDNMFLIAYVIVEFKCRDS